MRGKTQKVGIIKVREERNRLDRTEEFDEPSIRNEGKGELWKHLTEDEKSKSEKEETPVGNLSKRSESDASEIENEKERNDEVLEDVTNILERKILEKLSPVTSEISDEDSYSIDSGVNPVTPPPLKNVDHDNKITIDYGGEH